MCAGRGQDLRDARSRPPRMAAGRDVVIGYVETHGRKETDALAEGLPALPRRQVEYRGSQLTSWTWMPRSARHPQLVLVDELAHTNAPGSRHPKRYQDVLELLDAGIDVFTTLNVQHVESRAEAVRQITGITIHETLPDTSLDGRGNRAGGFAAGRTARAAGGGQGLSAGCAGAAQHTFSAPATCSPCANWLCASPPSTLGRMCWPTGRPTEWQTRGNPANASWCGQRQPDFGLAGALDPAAGR